MPVCKSETEISDHPCYQWAHGKSKDEPVNADIEALLSAEYWQASNIMTWFDDVNNIWHWNCDIKSMF